MAVVQYGQDLLVGVGSNVSGYIIESITSLDKDVTMEDVRDEDNQLTTRVVYQKMDKIAITLVPTTSANVSSDFVMGEVSTTAPLNGYFIDSASLVRIGGVAKLNVTATNIGIS